MQRISKQTYRTKLCQKILELAKENGLKSVTANIYAFNHQSRKMFEAVGFKQIDEEIFEYKF